MKEYSGPCFATCDDEAENEDAIDSHAADERHVPENSIARDRMRAQLLNTYAAVCREEDERAGTT